MNLLRQGLLFTGLFYILGLLYFNVYDDNSLVHTPRFRTVMHMYSKSNDIDNSDAEDELSKVEFSGINVWNMHEFLIL